MSGDPLAAAGGGAFLAGEEAPLWWHDGGLPPLRMQAAQAHLADVEGDSPPGFGVSPALAQARADVAHAEEVFATRLLQLKDER